jgi:hypothetical protein
MSRFQSKKRIAALAIVVLLALGALIEIRLGHLHALSVRLAVVAIFVAVVIAVSVSATRNRRARKRGQQR